MNNEQWNEEAAPVKRRRGWRRESNPLLIKELRGRMRGARAFVVLTVYLLLLTCFTSIMYYYVYTTSASGPGGAPQMAEVGKAVFASIVLIETFLVAFITPAFTAGAISGERERQTYEVLRTTLLPAHKLVGGKLASALTYVFLLILAVVPMESLAFVLGGVVVEELVLALVILLVTAVAFAAVGLFFSSWLRTTLASTVLAYGAVLATMVGLPALLVLSSVVMEPLMSGYSSSPPSWIVQAVLNYGLYLGVGLSPVTAAILTETTLQEQNTIWFFWRDVDATHRILIPSAWIVYTIGYLALALVLLLLAIVRVRRQETQ